MKTFALAVGLVACASLTARAADDKLDLSGTYKLVAGKKNGADADETAKKAEYVVTGDKFTIKGNDAKFVMSYKLDAKAKPAEVDMEILEGPDGTKGAKGYGIVELKDGVLKLAYALDKDKRPKDFDGKSGFYFELKKEKADKKDK
ncbi:MAG: TIGR03067 domain-containing protein [Gemmataceae bacterium]|nr:TIGR03067 domain-containing protein [Gemmataceae bacterium]